MGSNNLPQGKAPMRDKRLPTWAGALAGVGAATVLTWLLREGSQSFRAAIDLAQVERLTGAGWLLTLAGVVLAAVLWSARIHPLIVGVPAVWFLVRFAPLLLGAGTVPSWYPEWITNHVLVDANGASFLTMALLSVATLAELISHRQTSSPADQGKQVST